jgi:hypothetical protein
MLAYAAEVESVALNVFGIEWPPSYVNEDHIYVTV